MTQIVILPDELVSKIAAGEVVERPASVVKELIENSLDAGAKRIVCEVEDGGKRLIRVSDDGFGMTREDALLAIKCHATSKLASSDDLLSIASFGFRGEALPSIASISKMEIVTRTKDDVAGTKVRVAGGEVKEATEAGCPAGTSVTIRDLFYLVPARKKFLRTTQTELYHVVNAVTSLALSSPEVAFSMVHDGHTLFEFPSSSSLKDRVLSVFGLGFVKSTLELSSEGPLARIYGFVSTPETLSPARTRQLIFVNKRPVSSRSLVHAVYHGFGLEGRTRHPAFLLFIDIDSESVDVNVHPTKREIRMTNERAIHDLVVQTIRDALQVSSEIQEKTEATYSKPEVAGKQEALQGVQESFAGYRAERAEGHKMEELLIPEFWQLHRTYIIAQTKTGMIVVDQHTAHERILYEEILKNEKGAESQQLLFPRPVELSPQQSVLVEEKMAEIARLGFEVKKFSGNTFVVEAVPAYLENYRDETFTEFVLAMYEAGKAKAKSFDEMAKMLACKAAVKAGQSLTPEEMNSLLDRLFATKVPFFCPHGRPTVIRMSLEELGRRFGRI